MDWKKVSTCSCCLKDYYNILLTEIGLNKYVCDDCLEEIESQVIA